MPWTAPIGMFAYSGLNFIHLKSENYIEQLLSRTVPPRKSVVVHRTCLLLLFFCTTSSITLSSFYSANIFSGFYSSRLFPKLVTKLVLLKSGRQRLILQTSSSQLLLSTHHSNATVPTLLPSIHYDFLTLPSALFGNLRAYFVFRLQENGWNPIDYLSPLRGDHFLLMDLKQGTLFISLTPPPLCILAVFQSSPSNHQRPQFPVFYLNCENKFFPVIGKEKYTSQRDIWRIERNNKFEQGKQLTMIWKIILQMLTLLLPLCYHFGISYFPNGCRTIAPYPHHLQPIIFHLLPQNSNGPISCPRSPYCHPHLHLSVKVLNTTPDVSFSS